MSYLRSGRGSSIKAASPPTQAPVLAVIKVVFCLRRRAGMTPTEFATYWHDHHGPLVARFSPAMGVRRYVQSHPLPGPLNQRLGRPRRSPEPFDGVAEIWFDDLEALLAATSTAEGREAEAALRADEANFIDFSASPFFVVDVREMYQAGR